MINKYDGFIFDLDGTVYLDNQIIFGADKVINKLKELNKKIVFLSNKTTGNIEDYFNFLKSKNFNVTLDEFVNATEIVKKYLSEHHQNKNFYAVAEEKFIKEIIKAGLKFSEDYNQIEIILITLDRTFNSKKLDIAAKALINGAKFYAANIDNTCPVKDGEIMDAGTVISLLEKQTEKKLEKNFGKPSKYIIKEVLKKLNVNKEKCLIIGDRIETDIAMGNFFGIDTALVSTGIKNPTAFFKDNTPTYRFNSVLDLINYVDN
ncbi:MAG: hypothetical protein CR986_08260 [Ignavibacteriae bacterium]|nr:MAG: hypothetical protein CR986_08260 [Ignavibacteriota bacterium]